MPPWLFTKIELKTEDGAHIEGRYYKNFEGKPIAHLMVGHAMMVNINTLDANKKGGIIKLFLQQGIEVSLWNFRGHGHYKNENAIKKKNSFIKSTFLNNQRVNSLQVEIIH